MIVIALLAAPGLLGFLRPDPVGTPIPGLAAGKTVTLPAGDGGPWKIIGQRFDPPVTIEAGTVALRGLRIFNSAGIIWRGGVFTAKDGKTGRGFDGYCVNVRDSNRVSFDGIACSGAARGMVIADSRAVSIRGGRFTDLKIDGLNLPGSSDLLVERNRFTGFTPNPNTGNKADGTFKSGDHPDAVQLWTTQTNPRMTDIIIRDNIIEGDTQGINFFGPKGEGYARVVITGNRMRIAYPGAISIIDCDDCTITGNSVAKLPAAPFKANVRLTGSSGRFCGNEIVDVPNHIAAIPCGGGRK